MTHPNDPKLSDRPLSYQQTLAEARTILQQTYFPQQVSTKKSTASKSHNKQQLKAKGHG